MDIAQPRIIAITGYGQAEDEERYQTVQEMLIDLRRLKKESGHVQRPSHEPAVPPDSALPPQIGVAKKPARKRLWLVARTPIVALA